MEDVDDDDGSRVGISGPGGSRDARYISPILVIGQFILFILIF